MDPVRIPDDAFFAIGDNRRSSVDSRMFGPVPLANVVARASVIYWSRERRYRNPDTSDEYESGPIQWERIGTRLD
jgi:signal peptidase I